jgi:hypothetical protein
VKVDDCSATNSHPSVDNKANTLARVYHKKQKIEMNFCNQPAKADWLFL